MRDIVLETFERDGETIWGDPLTYDQGGKHYVNTRYSRPRLDFGGMLEKAKDIDCCTSTKSGIPVFVENKFTRNKLKYAIAQFTELTNFPDQPYMIAITYCEDYCQTGIDRIQVAATKVIQWWYKGKWHRAGGDRLRDWLEQR